MHSEGLTFQPIVEKEINTPSKLDLESEIDGDGKRIDQSQKPIDYPGEVQKMVLESKEWFFDEETSKFGDNNSIPAELKSYVSSASDDNMVTKFGKRIMHACSPKNGTFL